MTRRDSIGDLERAVKDLDDSAGPDSPMTIRFVDRHVDQDGDVVEEPEEVVEYDHCGPDLTMHETVVSTGWDPDR